MIALISVNGFTYFFRNDWSIFVSSYLMLDLVTAGNLYPVAVNSITCFLVSGWSGSFGTSILFVRSVFMYCVDQWSAAINFLSVNFRFNAFTNILENSPEVIL